MNVVAQLLEGRPPSEPCFIERRRDGARRVWSNADTVECSARLAGALAAHGVERGDVVMTYIGNRAEWLLALVACFRIGAVALPCNEQLRPADLVHRLRTTEPAVVLSDVRGLDAIAAAQPACPVLSIPDERLLEWPETAPVADMTADDPALITFTSGSTGLPKAAVHGHRYLSGQALQAQHWFGAHVGDVTWCTAASGWSKSARNAFLAPWTAGATPVLHDARFDVEERLRIVSEEKVAVLCMSPTEYRVIARSVQIPPLPSLRVLVAAGEALDEDVFRVWQRATDIAIRDGYGQTETGQITAPPMAEPPRPGSMGRPLPGIRAWIDRGELVIDPATVPTFFLGYLGEAAPSGEWRTGDLVHEDPDGYLYFDARADDIIISSGYRISPAEVERTVAAHPAVADVAVVGTPDADRGEVVTAVVVAATGYTQSEELAMELQEHAKREAAPYKYPRLIRWADELPRTASGKVRRVQLRGGHGEHASS